MNVREIAASELSSLLELYQHLHAKDDPLPDKDTVEAIWQELRVSPYHKYFGAFHEGRLISSCALALTPTLAAGCRPYGVIENVVTQASHRNRGFASAVLKKALDYSWSNNCYQVMLMSGGKEKAVFRLYASAGFNRYEKQVFIARPPAMDN